MSVDLAGLLRGWPYEPEEELTVRRITTAGGEPRLQIRLELGLIEMRCDGRPDGTRPHGSESLLHHYLATIEAAGDEFGLPHRACLELQREAMQYYQRRITAMRLGDYAAAAADAEHNLAVMDLLRDHAVERGDWQRSEQFRPYVLSHWTRARVLAALETGDVETAIGALDAGIDRIVQLFRDDYNRPELVQQSDELQQLRELRSSLLERRTSSRRRESDRDRIQRELAAAVAAEDFELAARLRDELGQTGGGERGA